MNLRHLAFITILLSIIFLPFWLYLPMILSAAVFFPVYWEAIVYGFIIDIFYGSGIEGFSELISPAALSATLVLIFLLWLKERLRLNF